MPVVACYYRYMRITRYQLALVAALVLHVGCGEPDPYTVVQSSCSAIVQGEVVTGSHRSTVHVGEVGQCTGVYIAPTVVLTAAHCGNPAYVMAHDVVRSNILYVPHPHYKADTRANDIALVFLDGELPLDIARLGAANYGPAVIQGYGIDENGYFGTLKEAVTDIVEFWAPNTLVTSQGPDTCYGDSGGPIYQGGIVVGITRSARPNTPTRSLDACGQGGLYTLVISHREWLDSEVDHLNWTSYCE